MFLDTVDRDLAEERSKDRQREDDVTLEGQGNCKSHEDRSFGNVTDMEDGRQEKRGHQCVE